MQNLPQTVDNHAQAEQPTQVIVASTSGHNPPTIHTSNHQQPHPAALDTIVETQQTNTTSTAGEANRTHVFFSTTIEERMRNFREQLPPELYGTAEERLLLRPTQRIRAAAMPALVQPTMPEPLRYSYKTDSRQRSVLRTPSPEGR